MKSNKIKELPIGKFVWTGHDVLVRADDDMILYIDFKEGSVLSENRVFKDDKYVSKDVPFMSYRFTYYVVEELMNH